MAVIGGQPAQSPGPRISVVIPALNEAQNLQYGR